MQDLNRIAVNCHNVDAHHLNFHWIICSCCLHHAIIYMLLFMNVCYNAVDSECAFNCPQSALAMSAPEVQWPNACYSFQATPIGCVNIRTFALIAANRLTFTIIKSLHVWLKVLSTFLLLFVISITEVVDCTGYATVGLKLEFHLITLHIFSLKSGKQEDSTALLANVSQ